MGKLTTLEQAERDFGEGKLGIARDRLHGLILSSPNDVSLRSRLGDVYSKLGYPIDAGRSWFLDEDLTAEKRDAVDQFVRSCNGDSHVILKRLKVRCPPAVLSTSFAQKKVDELIEDCAKRGIHPPDFKKLRPHEQPKTLKDSLQMYGCIVAVIILVVLFSLGVVTAIESIKSLF